MVTLPPVVPDGTAYTRTAHVIGRHPSWVRFRNNNTLEGTVEGQGIANIIRAVETPQMYARTDERMLTPPAYVGDDALDTDGLTAVIYAPSGAYAVFGRYVGHPYLDLSVTLRKDAPGKAVLEVPIEAGILSDGFTWSSGTGAVGRGYTVVVYADRTPVFGGRIREINKGRASVTLTIYDRLMELGLFSAQYQPVPEAAAYYKGYSISRTGTNPYTYAFDHILGTISTARMYNTLRISAFGADIDAEDQIIGPLNDSRGFCHPLPSTTDEYGVIYTPRAGDVIKRLRFKTRPTGGSIGISVSFFIGAKNGDAVMAYAYVPARSDDSGYYQPMGEFDYTIPADAGDIVVGAIITGHNLGGVNIYGTRPTPSDPHAVTIDAIYPVWRWRHTSDEEWRITITGDWSDPVVPEIEVDYIHEGSAVTPSSTSGNLVTASAPDGPHGNYLVTADQGTLLYIEEYVQDSLSVRALVRDLIDRAGLWDILDGTGYEDLGYMEYYTTGTHDWLTCLQELLRPSDLGIASDENGMLLIAPHRTTDGGAVIVATDGEDGVGIIDHDITRHWMAVADVTALYTEDDNGHPWGLETDDLLQEAPLIDSMGVMRQVEKDDSLRIPKAMARVAGGRIKQAHYNTVEGTVTLAGYQTALWNHLVTCARRDPVTGTDYVAPSYSGGNPLGIVLEEEGIDTVAVPTEITYHAGKTVVTLDNIRRADRSDVALSLGLTADMVSDSAVPDTVYVHVRAGNYASQIGAGMPVFTYFNVYCGGTEYVAGTDWTVHDSGTTYDLAGYTHLMISGEAVNTASAPIDCIRVYRVNPQIMLYIPLDVPIPILAGQKLVIDVRYRRVAG